MKNISLSISTQIHMYQYKISMIRVRFIVVTVVILIGNKNIFIFNKFFVVVVCIIFLKFYTCLCHSFNCFVIVSCGEYSIQFDFDSIFFQFLWSLHFKSQEFFLLLQTKLKISFFFSLSCNKIYELFGKKSICLQFYSYSAVKMDKMLTKILCFFFAIPVEI